MKALNVAKFGGTSMGDADCMRRSARLAVEHKADLVVVSATSGTTNQLIHLAHAAEKADGPQVAKLLQEISERHVALSHHLDLSNEEKTNLRLLLNELESLAQGIQLLKDCSARAMDSVMSLGERMSSVLFTRAMQQASVNVEWVDARELLKTDNQFGKARPLLAETKAACLKKLKLDGSRVYVTQGFIGSTAQGHTTTLGRGGSDYSAALLAEAIHATTLEIWTDVPGIASTDPRICKDAQPIREISFGEASELATFGAKILHPATLWPAIRAKIPVFVGSSFDPAAGGTWVKAEVETPPLVRALALRRKQALVTLTTPEMLYAHGFLAKVFKVFDDHRISVDAITTSEISVAMTFDDPKLLNKQVVEDLSQFAEVRVEENLSLVSLIGHNVPYTPGLAARIFSSLGEINVRMICQGASQRNFCFLVADEFGEEAVQRLHQTFIK